ncbi:MAG: hypothetical protein N3E40_03455, partial [Dehalococcoidia bacterium]|nr:hypothetical protein [Dehalococcoidia bacterium]
KALCCHRLDIVYLDLPLEDAAVRPVSGQAESLGFSFAGVIPETGNGDMLRLQYLSSNRVVGDDLQTASEFGRELLDYVMKDIVWQDTGHVCHRQ